MKKFINGPNIAVMKEVTNDDRRLIREAEMVQADGSVRRAAIIEVKGTAVLGQHYHPKPEYFTIVDGNPTVVTDVVTPDHQDGPGRPKVTRYTEGAFVAMAPGEAHAFHFDGPGTLISSMDGAYAPTDLIPHQLPSPEDIEKSGR